MAQNETPNSYNRMTHVKKKTIIGLLALSTAGVAQAAIFTEDANDLWSTAGNWSTGVVPSGITGEANDANITKGDDAVIDASYTELAPAQARNIRLLNGSNAGASGGRLTVSANAFLDANDLWGNGKQSRLYNYGTIDLTGNLDWDGRNAHGYNYASGTINTTGNLIVDANLANSFNNAGTLTGASLVGSGTINLTGGTMAFNSQTFFTTTGGTLIVSNDGRLTIVGDLASTLQTYVGTKIIGVTTDKIVYDSFNNLTIVNVPEPGTYALLAGCFALTSVMLRRRRS